MYRGVQRNERAARSADFFHPITDPRFAAIEAGEMGRSDEDDGDEDDADDGRDDGEVPDVGRGGGGGGSVGFMLMLMMMRMGGFSEGGFARFFSGGGAGGGFSGSQGEPGDDEAERVTGGVVQCPCMVLRRLVLVRLHWRRRRRRRAEGLVFRPRYLVLSLFYSLCLGRLLRLAPTRLVAQARHLALSWHLALCWTFRGLLIEGQFFHLIEITE